MSISSTNRKAGPYLCNGTVTAFPFEFKVFSVSDVRAVLTSPGGVESDMTLADDYTVSLNADQDSSPGGELTTTAAYPSGYKITLTSQVSLIQPAVLTNLGGFYPKVINSALDRLTILVQQVAEQVSRAVKVGISSSSTPDQLLSDLGDFVESASSSATSSAVYAANSADSAIAAADSAVAAAASEALSASNAASVGFTVSDLQGQGKTAVTSTGTAPSFIVSTLPSYGALLTGQRMRVKFHTAGLSSGNTLNRDGLGAKNLVQYDATGSKVVAAIASGMLTDVEYDGIDLVILNPLPVKGAQLFTGSGAWTCPAGVTKAWISGSGAGGGAGGGQSSSPGGGGGGASAVIKSLQTVDPGVTYAVTVGGGGLGGTGPTAAGVAGGVTSFGSLISLPGGGAGGGSSVGAPGGVAGGAGGGAGASGSTGLDGGGGGGGSIFGSGGPMQAPVGVAGVNGSGYGGGGGACQSASVPSGSGANGFILVEW